MPIEKLRVYYNSEYNITRAALNAPNHGITREKLWNTVQRGVGASYMAQMLGAKEEEVVSLYEDFKTKIMNLEELL